LLSMPNPLQAAGVSPGGSLPAGHQARAKVISHLLKTSSLSRFNCSFPGLNCFLIPVVNSETFCLFLPRSDGIVSQTFS
jgi:hypothetical protein